MFTQNFKPKSYNSTDPYIQGGGRPYCKCRPFLSIMSCFNVILSSKHTWSAALILTSMFEQSLNLKDLNSLGVLKHLLSHSSSEMQSPADLSPDGALLPHTAPPD